MLTIILSPHIDDAVFSCWHLISEGAKVVNVFAGVPPTGTTTLWDRLCGQSDSASMMRHRLEENAKIFKHIKSGSAHNLDYLDGQYKPGKRNLSEITDSIEALAPHDTTFFAPVAASGLWRHPDHVFVRELGKHLMGRGKKVAFYADIPYMSMPASQIGNYLNRASRKASEAVGLKLSAEVVELTPSNQTLKRKYMHGYKSQYGMTNLVSFGMLGKKANVQREVVFHAK